MSEVLVLVASGSMSNPSGWGGGGEWRDLLSSGTKCKKSAVGTGDTPTECDLPSVGLDHISK